MAPSAIDVEPTSLPSREHRKPLKASGSLDQFEQIDVTPVIGTEFPTAQLTDWINSPNADDLLRDLAIKSESFRYTDHLVIINSSQSRNAVWSSSVPKTD